MQRAVGVEIYRDVDPLVRLREIFTCIDTGRDGSLNFGEFFYFLQVHNPSIPQAQAEVFFSKIDKSGDRKITWDEFSDAARNPALGLYYILTGGVLPPNHPVFTPTVARFGADLVPAAVQIERRKPSAKELQSALQLFQRIDVDHDDNVTFSEFYNGIKATDPSYPDADIQRLFSLIDTDRSKTITVDEFLAGISKGTLNTSLFARLATSISEFDWEISPSEITLGGKLGEGTYGEVSKGQWRGAKVAVKRLKDVRRDPRVQKAFLGEVNILSKLRHPNCVLFLGATVNPPEFMMITEYCEKGTLTNVLSTKNLSRYHYHKVAIGIALGLAYLHLRQPIIIHRDLKPDNILLDDSFTPKLADFGLSTILTLSTDATRKCGSPAYMAPEIWRQEVYSEKVDIYSYAIVLYECTYYQGPFSCQTLLEFQNTSDSDVRPVLTANIDPTISRIITTGWNRNPAIRPSADTVVKELGQIMGSFRG